MVGRRPCCYSKHSISFSCRALKATNTIFPSSLLFLDKSGKGNLGGFCGFSWEKNYQRGEPGFASHCSFLGRKSGSPQTLFFEHSGERLGSLASSLGVSSISDHVKMVWTRTFFPFPPEMNLSRVQTQQGAWRKKKKKNPDMRRCPVSGAGVEGKRNRWRQNVPCLTPITGTIANDDGIGLVDDQGPTITGRSQTCG